PAGGSAAPCSSSGWARAVPSCWRASSPTPRLGRPGPSVPGGASPRWLAGARFALPPRRRPPPRGARSAGRRAGPRAGCRGALPADAAALVDLVLRLARLADDVPELAELDLNPVLALPDGCVAVDARIRLRPGALAPRAKTW